MKDSTIQKAYEIAKERYADLGGYGKGNGETETNIDFHALLADG